MAPTTPTGSAAAQPTPVGSRFSTGHQEARPEGNLRSSGRSEDFRSDLTENEHARSNGRAGFCGIHASFLRLRIVAEARCRDRSTCPVLEHSVRRRSVRRPRCAADHRPRRCAGHRLPTPHPHFPCYGSVAPAVSSRIQRGLLRRIERGESDRATGSPSRTRPRCRRSRRQPGSHTWKSSPIAGSPPRARHHAGSPRDRCRHCCARPSCECSHSWCR